MKNLGLNPLPILLVAVNDACSKLPAKVLVSGATGYVHCRVDRMASGLRQGLSLETNVFASDGDRFEGVIVVDDIAQVSQHHPRSRMSPSICKDTI